MRTIRDRFRSHLLRRPSVMRYRTAPPHWRPWIAACDRHYGDDSWISEHDTHAEAFAAALAHVATDHTER